MIKLMYQLFRYSRIAGVLCFLAVWRMLFMGCSKRRYLRTSSIHFLYWVIDFYEKILIVHDINLPTTWYISYIYNLSIIFQLRSRKSCFSTAICLCLLLLLVGTTGSYAFDLDCLFNAMYCIWYHVLH